MSNSDNIVNLFKEKFDTYSPEVRADLWNAVSANIPKSTLASKGLSLFSKSIIGVASAAAIGIGTYYLTGTTIVKEHNQKSVSKDVSNEAIEVTNTVTNSESISQNSVHFSTKSTLSSIDQQVFEPIVFESITDYEKQEVERTEIVDNVTHVSTPSLQEHVSSEHNSEKMIQNENKESEIAESKEIVPSHVENETANVFKNLPNTFSPNFDGINDFLYLENNNMNDFSITVMNMQNVIVYQSTDVNFKWNGEDKNGNMLPAGNYIYYVVGKNSDGKTIAKSSYLTISK